MTDRISAREILTTSVVLSSKPRAGSTACVHSAYVAVSAEGAPENYHLYRVGCTFMPGGSIILSSQPVDLSFNALGLANLSKGENLLARPENFDLRAGQTDRDPVSMRMALDWLKLANTHLLILGREKPNSELILPSESPLFSDAPPAGEIERRSLPTRPVPGVRGVIAIGLR